MTAKRVFITGGAAGLGAALARQLTAEGARVCLGDISDADGAATDFVRCDVTQAEDVAQAAAWVQDNWGGVDLVINNAGVAQMGPLAQTPDADWQWIFDINVMGIVRVTRAFAPIMRAQGHGAFLNIASMAGYLHLPNMAAYNATKAAVVALSETMMLELEDAGITTHVACPSFFRTDLAKGMRASDAIVAQQTTRLVERARMGAGEVAKAILAGLARGESHIFPHPEGEAAWQAKRSLPFETFLSGMRADVAKMEARMADAPKDLKGAPA